MSNGARFASDKSGANKSKKKKKMKKKKKIKKKDKEGKVKVTIAHPNLNQMYFFSSGLFVKNFKLKKF